MATAKIYINPVNAGGPNIEFWSSCVQTGSDNLKVLMRNLYKLYDQRLSNL